MKTFLRILKWVGVFLAVLIAAFFVSRWIGRSINKRTPDGGINESLFVEINGSKQWINIYGKSIDHPVLLYLHGGPGSSTSTLDYAYTRKWSDVYTVVTWDQRGCGKSYDKSRRETITADTMMADGVAMTEFLIDHLKVDKITLLGHSWGSYFGANLSLEHPDYYDAFIGTGQFIDYDENEKRLHEAALEWSKDDPEGRALVEQWYSIRNAGFEALKLRQEILERYGYDMMKDGTDFNVFFTALFNPGYSLKDFVTVLGNADDCFEPYSVFLDSDGFRNMSLLGRYDYAMPFYNIDGDMDYQTNFELACDYFQQVNAPAKRLFVMKNATHGLLESRSEEFSGFIHEIAELQAEKSLEQ